MKLNDFFEKIKINKKIFFLIYLISITIISIFYASSKSQDEAFFVINFIMIFSALSAGIIFLIIFWSFIRNKYFLGITIFVITINFCYELQKFRKIINYNRCNNYNFMYYTICLPFFRCNI